MSELFLPVPHRTEAFIGGCLPACCEMALAYCGILETQAVIAAQIGHIEGAGAPARNITRLAALGVKVVWHELGSAADLQQAIAAHTTPVVFLRIGDFQLAWDEFGGQWAAIQCL